MDNTAASAAEHARTLMMRSLSALAGVDTINELVLEGDMRDAAETAATVYVPHDVPTGFTRDEVAHVARKLARNEEIIEPRDAFITEAIIIPDLRPAIDVIDGDYAIDHPAWPDYATGTPAHSAFTKAMPAVGRIELPGNPSIPFGGTGFVVGRGLVMTNRHVARLFAEGVGTRGLRLVPGIDPGIDLKCERDTAAGTVFAVRRIRMIHPYWDMALLEVEGIEAIEPLTLAGLDPEGAQPRRIAVIGYPAFDPRNRADVQDRVFRGIYNVKRLQPGLFSGRRAVASFGKSFDAACHDSSTLGGNSGSVVLDAETGDVVGVHFAGVYKDSNFAVASVDMVRDGRVIDAGVTIRDGGYRASGTWDDWWVRTELAEAPLKVDEPPSTPARPPLGPSGSARPIARSLTTALAPLNCAASVTIPLTITIALANDAVTAQAQASSLGEVVALIGQMHDLAPSIESTADHGRFEGLPAAVSLDESGRSAHLLTPISFTTADGAAWPVPAGAWLDGASIPRVFWSLIGGPFEGRYRESSIVHDHYCITQTRPWRETHRMFHAAMLARAVPGFKARIMFYAVYRFGPRWLDLAGAGGEALPAAPPIALNDDAAASLMADALVLARSCLDAAQIERLADANARGNS